MPFAIGQQVAFAGTKGVVEELGGAPGEPAYRVVTLDAGQPIWVPESVLDAHQQPGRPTTQFRSEMPALLSVDDFFYDPDEVRAIALAQQYAPDLRYYKGLRSQTRFLWPFLREEFGRLLGRPVTEWLGYPANGIFQQTSSTDPLVWHADTQQYAAAVYLTPDAPPSAGTSFWRDKTFGCRHVPDHPVEARRLNSPEAIKAAGEVIFDHRNIEHGDNFELVESIAGLYNRLVIWDARLIHSATSYDQFDQDGVAETRLVQLFFFDAG